MSDNAIGAHRMLTVASQPKYNHFYLFWTSVDSEISRTLEAPFVVRGKPTVRTISPEARWARINCTRCLSARPLFGQTSTALLYGR